MDAANLTEIPTLIQALETAGLWLVDRVWHILKEPLYTGSRLHVGYLFGALVLAGISFRLYAPAGEGGTLKRFFAYCFPREVWRHPSAVLDYKLFLANKFVGPLISVSGVALTTGITWWIAKTLNATLGVFPYSLPWNAWSIGVTSVVFILLADLVEYGLHWMQHRVPALWQFHRVHHSAETLTPITLFRVHPFLDAFFNAPVRSATLGALSGVLFYLFFQGDGAPVVLPPVLLSRMLFNALGSNLRHSHIWLSYGWILSHVFVSPAMHQIHHSIAPEHLYKNLGVTFAFWDWMFGTIYVPRQREELTFGLYAGAPQVHPTVWRAYVEPFSGIRAEGARDRAAPPEAPREARVEPGPVVRGAGVGSPADTAG